MGSMISNKILENSIINQHDLYISNRTRIKTKDLEFHFPLVNIVNNIDAVNNSNIILLCVKPNDFIDLLKHIQPFLTTKKHLISITGSIPISTIEHYHNGPVSIAIPTITGEVGKGVSVFVSNSKISLEDKTDLVAIFSTMGKVKEVDPLLLDIMIDLTSCTPGFIGALFSNYASIINKHIKEKEFNEDVTNILIETLKGTIDLIDTKQMTFDEVITRVATKGGITEEGIKIINEKMPDVFEQIIHNTMEKRQTIMKSISKI